MQEMSEVWSSRYPHPASFHIASPNSPVGALLPTGMLVLCSWRTTPADVKRHLLAGDKILLVLRYK